MLSLDLFNSRYEKKLHEGAVDDAIAHLIEPLSRRAMDIRTKLRTGRLDPKQVVQLEKEYEELVQKRLDIILDRKTQTEQQVPSKQDPFAYVKPEPKGIGDVQDPKAKMAQLAQNSKKGALANVGAGLKAFIKGEPEPMDEEQQAINPRALGVANFQRLVKANMGNIPTVSLEFIRPEENFKLDQKGLDLISDYYDGLESDQAKNYFIYRVLPSGDETLKVLKQLGYSPVQAQQQQNLPGIPTQSELPLQEKKKSNNDDLEAGDIKVARELQKLRAEYPAARSDVEAVARAEIDSTERSQRQLAAIRGANEKQDALLKQLVALDQEQGREISGLDKENNSLEQRLAQVQATNDRLQQTIGQMTGTKKAPARKPTDAEKGGIIDLAPIAAPAEVPGIQPEPAPKQQKATAGKSPAMASMAQQIQALNKPAPGIRPAPGIKSANEPQAQAVAEHGGGIGPRQHWQDLMQEGQPQELINRYLAIDAETDVEAVRKAIQAISRDPALGANSKSRLLGQIGMIIRRHRLPIGRSYYTYMQQYMEAVELDRNRVVGYPQDPATVKHRLDTAKAILGDPRSDADSRREASAIVAKLEKKAVAEGLLYSGDTWQDVLYRINVLNDIFGDQKDLAATFEPASQPEWIPFRDQILRSRTVLDTYAKVKQLANMNVPLTNVEIEMLADVAWDGGGGPVEPAGHWGERDYDWLEDLYAQQFAVVQHLLDQRAQGHGQNKTKSGQTVHEQGMAETVTNVKAGMAEIYRRLAPKIERHRDSFLAGQLYDELENYAELHGAEGEFKRMMATARNSAHMEYDTNPGGFQNWFWFLPFEDNMEEGIKSQLAGAALAGALALGAGSANARVTGDEDPGVNRLTGKPNVTQAVQGDQVKPSAPAGYSKEYLQSVIDGTHPRPLVSKEKAQALLNQLKEQGMAESTDDIKKRMSKLEALALAANRAGDDAKCKRYQEKIQSLKQKLSQSMNEGLRSGEYHIHTVYFKDGTKKRIRVTSDEFDVVGYYKQRGQAVDRVDYDFQIHSDVTEQFAMPGTTIPRKSVIQGYTVFFNPKTRLVSITRGGDSEEAAIEQARIGTPSIKNFRLAADRLITKIESELNEAKEIVTKNDFLDRRDYLLRMISADSNPANKQIIKAEIRKLESQAEAEGWITMQQRMVREDSDSGEAVEMAIMRRMLVAHTDLIVEFGLDKIVDAIEEVAYNVGDVDEIGTSDVSGWVRQVKQILGVDA
jgi:hypothetical protein